MSTIHFYVETFQLPQVLSFHSQFRSFSRNCCHYVIFCKAITRFAQKLLEQDNAVITMFCLIVVIFLFSEWVIIIYMIFIGQLDCVLQDAGTTRLSRAPELIACLLVLVRTVSILIAFLFCYVSLSDYIFWNMFCPWISPLWYHTFLLTLTFIKRFWQPFENFICIMNHLKKRK